MSDEEKTPGRQVVIEFAQSHYHYFRTSEGSPYAVRRGSSIARPIRSQGTTGSHRQELILGLLDEGRGVFSGTAMKEALDVLEAETLRGEVVPVHIRVAPCRQNSDVSWMDLGRADGLSVRIAPGSWELRRPEFNEVVWRRTQLVGELPVPLKDQGEKGLADLLELCNFLPDTEPLVIAWLIGCLDPNRPVPAAYLTGPNGAGKSTTGRMLSRVIEGMDSDLRRPPKEEGDLIVSVAAGWITALDNMSHINKDMSDLMCCIVTGAESVKRMLHTDGDVVRQRYRRPLLLTGIDVGVVRPDLGERLVQLRMERPKVRRSEGDLWTAFEKALPTILGGLLDLAATVRASDTQMPTDLRMTDFAHLCARLDSAFGLASLASYRSVLDDIHDDVLEGDPLAQTVMKYALGQAEPVRQSATEWLNTINSAWSEIHELEPRPKGWPTTGKVLSDRLKRLASTLSARGVVVEWGRYSRHEDPNRGRYMQINRTITPLRHPDTETSSDTDKNRREHEQLTAI